MRPGMGLSRPACHPGDQFSARSRPHIFLGTQLRQQYGREEQPCRRAVRCGEPGPVSGVTESSGHADCQESVRRGHTEARRQAAADGVQQVASASEHTSLHARHTLVQTHHTRQLLCRSSAQAPREGTSRRQARSCRARQGPAAGCPASTSCSQVLRLLCTLLVYQTAKHNKLGCRLPLPAGTPALQADLQI